jgi:HD-GYP domain-containing protein (c-di-GMP phosphodiesterase class II)
MAKYQRVGPSDVKLGEPLPFAVYDDSGILLLNAGYSVKIRRHLEILLDRGIYYQADARPVVASRPRAADAQAEETNTFLILDTSKIRMQRLLELVRSGRAREGFVDRIEDIALTIQEACSHDTDAALANLHLDYDTSYAIVHQMQAAVLCEIVGRKLGVGEDARLTLVKAALTHDIGLIDIQDELDKQLTPLTDEQKNRVRHHPRTGAKVLRELGVREAGWLDAVEHHHERLDGSGYPDGLMDADIAAPTRVLAIADIYSAMIRDRPYRKAMVTNAAMRELLLEQGNKTDNRLIHLMIKEVGVFPPGAIVQLTNKEISVVKQRQDNNVFPIVYSFVKPTGMPMLTPMRRETSNPEHKIEGIVSFATHRGSIAVIRGLWTGTTMA